MWIYNCQYRRMTNQRDDVRALEPCCPPAREPLEPQQAAEAAATFKVLADPVRIRLLALIATRASGDAVCVCELTACFELAQPTISHHLKVLRTAGLIDCERRGTWVYYWPLAGALDRVRTVLDGLTEAVPA